MSARATGPFAGLTLSNADGGRVSLGSCVATLEAEFQRIHGVLGATGLAEQLAALGALRGAIDLVLAAARAGSGTTATPRRWLLGSAASWCHAGAPARRWRSAASKSDEPRICSTAAWRPQGRREHRAAAGRGGGGRRGGDGASPEGVLRAGSEPAAPCGCADEGGPQRRRRVGRARGCAEPRVGQERLLAERGRRPHCARLCGLPGGADAASAAAPTSL